MNDSPGKEENKRPFCEIIKKAAVVFTGFSILQAVRLAITCGPYAVKRFGISTGETGIFIKMMLNTSEIFCVFGIIATTAYSMLRGSKPEDKIYDKYLSITITWLNFLAFVIIFIAYYTGGTKGHLTIYYWAVVFSSLTYGLHQSMVLSMVTKDIAYYFMGLPMSGIQVLTFHVVFRFIYNKLNRPNIEFYLVTYQIVIAMILWLLSSIFWTYTFYDYDPKKEHEKLMQELKQKEEKEKASQGLTDTREQQSQDEVKSSFFQRLMKASSPFFMNIFGMAFIFFFYPAIAPYQLVEYEFGYRIDLCILFTSAMAALVLVILVRLEIGPNRAWEAGFGYYHCAWLLFLLYYGCMLTFITCLHFPLSPISQYILERPYIVGVLTVLLKTLDDFIRGISTAGISMQNKKEDGDMATLSNCIAQILLNLFSFLGMGYIKAFRMYNEDTDNWPTMDMTLTKAFGFWVKKAIIGGWKAFLQSFTLNVRSHFESQGPDDLLGL